MLMRKCLLAMLILMLVILMLILMLLNLNTGYADTDADLCIRIISLCSSTKINPKDPWVEDIQIFVQIKGCLLFSREGTCSSK